MSGRGRRGRPRRAILEAFERPAVPEGVEHGVGSSTTSMNHPPVAGQARPSGPLEGAQVPGFFYCRAGGTDCSDSGYSDSSSATA